MQAYRNGQRVTQVSLLDRAFAYGDGCFSTARVMQQHWQLRARHLQRLERACAALSLDANLSVIQHSWQQLQHDCDSPSAVLKILISRGVGARGYAMPVQAADVYVLYFPQAVTNTDSSLRIIESGLLQRKMGLCMPELCGVKSLNRLEQVLLKQEAQQRGWPEALVTDIQGWVVEGVSSNCFMFINNQWVTPDLAYNGVAGVMRAEILARMQQQGIACSVRAVAVHELEQMQALFFCSALQPMQAVNQYDGRRLALEPATALFEQLKLAQID